MLYDPFATYFTATIMPITEIVIGSLKPEVAKEGLAALRTGNFFNVAGPLSNYVGHIIRHNGKDIESEYRPLLAIGQFALPFIHYWSSWVVG